MLRRNWGSDIQKQELWHCPCDNVSGQREAGAELGAIRAS